MAKMSTRGLMGKGHKAMTDSRMTRKGPSTKNLSTGATRRPNPVGEVTAKMRKGKLRGPGANGC